jgi:hypothetical protein
VQAAAAAATNQDVLAASVATSFLSHTELLASDLHIVQIACKSRANLALVEGVT